jgi:hypothetical protein
MKADQWWSLRGEARRQAKAEIEAERGVAAAHVIRLGPMRAFKNLATGEIFPFGSNKDKQRAFAMALHPLKSMDSGKADGPKLWLDTENSLPCYVRPSGERLYFASEAERRLSRLLVWSDEHLPKRIVPSIADDGHLILRCRRTKAHVDIFVERPFLFRVALTYFKRERKKRAKSKASD